MHSIPKLLSTLAASALSIAANAQTLASCHLLAEYRNDLWLASGNGSALSRITNDGQSKPAAALQPGSGLVAYSTQDPLRNVVLSDAAGRTLAQIGTGTEEPVIGLAWTGPGALRVAVHQSPQHSQFHFFSLQPGNRLIRSSTGSANGTECVPSPAGKHLACFVGDSITLDGRDLYFAPTPFESSTVLQTPTLALGTALTTGTTPALRVFFKERTADAVTLRVSLPDNGSLEQRIPTGATMTVQTYEASGILGLEPVPTGDSHTIKLVVKQSSTGQAAFEGNLAWDLSGNRVAAIERNDAGQRSLVLLARQMGNAATQGQGAIKAKIRLPIQGPVNKVRFLTDTTIRIEGMREALEYDSQSSGKAKTPVLTTRPLPQVPTTVAIPFNGSPVLAKVRDWSCP